MPTTPMRSLSSFVVIVDSTDFLPQYQSWENTDPVDLFTAGIRKVESNPKVALRALHQAPINPTSTNSRCSCTRALTLIELNRIELNIVQVNVCKHLRKEAKGATYLVLWLDCDREGENICFEVIDTVKDKLNPPHGGKQHIYRAKFSGMSPAHRTRELDAERTNERSNDLDPRALIGTMLS